MREFKHITLTQLLAILFLSGVALGTLAGYPIHHTRIVRVMPEQIMPEKVYRMALRKNNVLFATYHEGSKMWLYIDKEGKPRQLFWRIK